MILGRKRSTNSGPFDYSGEELKINVVFEKQGDNNWPISVKIVMHQNTQKQIMLSEIIWRLKEQSLNDYFDSSVSYFHQQRQIYIFGFILPPDIKQQDLFYEQKYKKRIHESAFGMKNGEIYLHLRFRKKIGSRFDLLKEQQRIKYNQFDQVNKTKQSKQKQKTISEVIEKVALWRKLYTGFLDEKGQIFHMDLDSSANEIGIAKKTLDDYLLQIRNGKRYGFNFHKRRFEKIGQLRSFVREKKLENQKDPKNRK